MNAANIDMDRVNEAYQCAQLVWQINRLVHDENLSRERVCQLTNWSPLAVDTLLDQVAPLFSLQSLRECQQSLKYPQPVVATGYKFEKML